ncbi:MAG: tetratricopeptide repeat protein [Bacteroidota bacterium]
MEKINYSQTTVLAVFFLALQAFGQTSTVIPTVLPDRSIQIDRWSDAGTYSVTRHELEHELPYALSIRSRSDLIYSIIQTSVDGKDYEEAYQWSTTFISEYPNDRRRTKILYYRGLSAYQTDRLDTALTLLNYYLSLPTNDMRGEAYYWRGLVDVENNEWNLAEDDFRQAYNDTISVDQRDRALIGWSLALEHHGSLAEAIKLLQRMREEFPESKYANDGRLRLASLSLQQKDPGRALDFLKDLELSSRTQREESRLLYGEAHLQRNDYAAAKNEFQKFLQFYPESPFATKARFGLAWAYLNNGEPQSAKLQFDSLGTGSDTLSLNALYQSGALSLLNGSSGEAMKSFGILIDKSPYEIYSDKAYYQMGMDLYRSKHYREARKNFEIITRLFPESDLRMKSYRMLGEASVALSDFANAQYAFGQLRRLGAPADLLAPAMVQEGICLYHLGRFKSSAERFQDFLNAYQKDPRVPEAYLWQGEALYQDARFDEAEAAYKKALDLLSDGEKRSLAAYGIAWSLFEEKKFSHAADAFAQFTGKYPGSDKALDASLRRADCYFFMKQYDKASAMYASLAAEKNSSKNTEYAAFQLAMSYIQRGESMRGIEQLRDFQLHYPNSIYAEVVQFNIGWTYYTMEQYPQAIIELKLLARKFPYSQLMPRIFFNIGDAFYNTKQYDSARTYYEQVIQQFPKSPLANDAMSGLKYTFQAQGRPMEALSTIDKYMKSQADTGLTQNLLLNKADILFGQGDLNGAIDQYKKLIALHPEQGTYTRALEQLGHIYELKRDTSSARAYYKQILSDFPTADNAPRAALALAIACTSEREFSAAVDLLQKFEGKYSASPLIPEAQYRLGIAYLLMPNRAKAKSQFEQIISQRPTDVFSERSRMIIAKIYQDEKEYSTAIDTLNGIANRRSDDIAAEALIMMGDNYLLSKKNIDALQAYKDVITQYSDYPLLIEKAHLGAGSAYEKLHDRKHARLEYQEILKSPIDSLVKREATNRLKRIKR